MIPLIPANNRTTFSTRFNIKHLRTGLAYAPGADRRSACSPSPKPSRFLSHIEAQKLGGASGQPSDLAGPVNIHQGTYSIKPSFNIECFVPSTTADPGGA